MKDSVGPSDPAPGPAETAELEARLELGEWLAALPHRAYGRTLELGCGAGLRTGALPGDHVLCLDPSAEALQAAQARTETRADRGRFQFQQASPFALAAQGVDPFDLVVVRAPLGPAPWGRAFSELDSILPTLLGPDGLLLSAQTQEQPPFSFSSRRLLKRRYALGDQEALLELYLRSPARPLGAAAQLKGARASTAWVIFQSSRGPELEDALEAAFAQTSPPQEIVVVDEAPDPAGLIRSVLEGRYPGRFRTVVGAPSAAPDTRWQRALAATRAEAVLVVGAAERPGSDLMARTLDAFEHDAQVAVAYGDLTIHGPGAPDFAAQKALAPTAVAGVYTRSLGALDPTELPAIEAEVDGHGAALYRRSLLQPAPPSWSAVLRQGHRIAHVPEAWTESYRGEGPSAEGLQQEALFFRRAARAQRQRNLALHRRVASAERRLAQVRGVFQTQSPLQRARTLTVNLLAPERARVLEYLLASARATWRRQPRPQLPEGLYTDEQLK